MLYSEILDLILVAYVERIYISRLPTPFLLYTL